MRINLDKATLSREIEVGDLLVIKNVHSGTQSTRLIIRDEYRNKFISVDLHNNQVAFDFDTLERLHDFYYGEADNVTLIKSKNIEVIVGV